MRRFPIGPRAWLNLGVAVASLALTLGLALAQDNPPEPDPKGAAAKDKDKNDPKAKKNAKGRRGPVAPAGAPPKKGRPKADDPLAGRRAANGNANANAPADGKAAVALPTSPPAWPFHYKLRIAGVDGTPLAASYYPARTKLNAPVLMLVHDKGSGRSGKDFEEKLDELKGQSLAEYLQEQGYAVIVPDLRGHGQNVRHEVGAAEWQAMTGDLQAIYYFLVDRHNRAEFNLAKLGVIALGDSANLVAAWAATPGAAISGERPVGDLSGLVLISPVPDSLGLKLQQILPPVAPRIPIYLACGDRDQASLNVVKACQQVVERHQRSKVSFFDSSLHATKLLQFYGKAPGAITRFLDDPVKGRVVDWEPRFLLTPVAYQSDGVVETAKAKSALPKAKDADPKAKDADPKAKEAPDAKAKEKDKADN